MTCPFFSIKLYEFSEYFGLTPYLIGAYRCFLPFCMLTFCLMILLSVQKRFFAFWLLNCKCSLYDPDTSHISGISHIFSSFVSCTYTFLIVSVKIQKFLFS